MTIAIVGVVVLLVAGAAFWLWLMRDAPSADRDWAADQAVAASVSFEDGRVHIENLRDFRHGPDGTFEPAYRNETYDLADVRGIWFVLAPFARRWRGLAHGFVSFELTGGRFVSISVEARREADEEYSLLGGLVNRFEVSYVVGTEEDLIGLRAVRGDTLFVYPSRATPEQASALFADMLRGAERVRTEPVFYHTVFRNCMTILRDHVNRLEGVALPYGWGVLLPGFSDRLALESGLLDTDLPLDEARERFRVDEVARDALAAGEGFSTRIREAARSDDPRGAG
jgi:hypothetical protein